MVLDRQPPDDELTALFDAGCDDAAFGVEHGLATAEFDRKATALADAIASAVHELESAHLTAVRVLDEDLLTLADSADRIQQSRESVRRYAPRRLPAAGQPEPRGHRALPVERGRAPAP